MSHRTRPVQVAAVELAEIVDLGFGHGDELDIAAIPEQTDWELCRARASLELKSAVDAAGAVLVDCCADGTAWLILISSD